MGIIKRNENRKPIYRKLRHKYRLVILNDDTFEERFSLILSPLNVFTWGGVVVFALVGLVSSAIIFTPLREYIPGYTDLETRRQVLYAVNKADSLQIMLDQKDLVLENIQSIIAGRPVSPIQQADTSSKPNYNSLDFAPSKEDSMLRETIESEDRYSLVAPEDASRVKGISGVFFFPPIKGTISGPYDLQKKHFGVDIVAADNEAIKATLDGTVVLSTWTQETGHVIQLQHQNGLISVYKHNSVLLKKEGEKVKAGEVIAIIGNSGSESTGPHLHFELWLNGEAVDPQRYMAF